MGEEGWTGSGWGSAGSADDVGLWAMVKTLADPAAFGSCWGRWPRSRCCSCCSGCYLRWEAEGGVHHEVVYRSW